MNVFSILKRTYQEWSANKASRLAAALAYYTIFSLAPLLIIVIAIASLIWPQAGAKDLVMTQIQGLVGQQGAQFVDNLIQSTSNKGQGMAGTVIGILTLLLGALSVFNELRNDLNTIWDVKEEKAANFWQAIKKAIFERFLSFAMVLGIGFLLLVSLVVSTALTASQQFLGTIIPLTGFTLQLINLAISIGVITLLFAMIYKYLPDAKISWRDVWLGAFVTAVLFSIGKTLIGLYLGNSAVASSFGAAGSLVLLLIWIYYSAQILFFGAEFTQVHANMYGSKIVPENKDSAPKSEQKEAQRSTKPYGGPQHIPVTGSSHPMYVATEEENKKTARYVLGFMAVSFFTGMLASIFGFKQK